MDTEFIQSQILRVFKQCGIKSFPINCFTVLETLEISLKPYSSLSVTKQKQCLLISDDAFILKDIIYYNDRISLDGRMRFSLMHELGHIVLKHKENLSSTKEKEANFFASNLLAPRMLIHYSGCKNAQDVAHFFHLSLEASDYAFCDYRRWHRMAIYRMSLADQTVYDYFYEPKIRKLAFDTHQCIYCQREIFNHPRQMSCPICRNGQATNSMKLKNPFSPESRIQSFLKSQQQ